MRNAPALSPAAAAARQPQAPQAPEASPLAQAGPGPAPAGCDIFARGNLFSDACPSRAVLRHLTSRWGVLVLVALLDGTHRFSQLRRRIRGVSERMLAQTLQDLEADGILHRRALPVVPPHVEYDLTPLGQDAARQVRGLFLWVEDNLPRLMAAQGPSGPAIPAADTAALPDPDPGKAGP